MKIAIPSFTGLPTDPVQEVDVYGEVDDKVKNELVSKITAFGTDTSKLIQQSIKTVKDLKAKYGNVITDINVVRRRVEDALKGSRSAIEGLATDLEQIIFGELTGVDGVTGYVKTASDMYDSVQMVIDAKNYYFRDGNIRNVNDVLNFIGDLSGNSLIGTFDLGAEAALVKGILTEISDWGIADLIDETLGAKWNEDSNKYDYKYNDDFRFSVVKRSSEDLSPNASLSVIDRLMEHGGDKALIANNPDFPIQLVAGYVLPIGCVPGEAGSNDGNNYTDELNMMVGILDRLKADWYLTKRGTTEVFNLYFLKYCSQDAITLFNSAAKYREPVMTSQNYEMTSGRSLILKFYPMALV